MANKWEGAADGILKENIGGQGGQEALLLYRSATAAILEVNAERQDDAAEHQESVRTVLKMLAGGCHVP